MTEGGGHVWVTFELNGQEYLFETTAKGDNGISPIDEVKDKYRSQYSIDRNFATYKYIFQSKFRVWINSYPTGAEVYLLPAKIDIDTPKLEDVVKSDNLLGVTPLTYELHTEEYYVVTVFVPELFVNVDLPTQSDPAFDKAFPFDGNYSHTMVTSKVGNIQSFSKLYRLTKSISHSDTLISIALPLPENYRGQPKPVMYPILDMVETLPVSYKSVVSIKQSIEKELSKHNLTAPVGSDMVDEMIEILLRVGKVKLDTDEITLTTWMHGTDTTTYSTTVTTRK